MACIMIHGSLESGRRRGRGRSSRCFFLKPGELRRAGWLTDGLKAFGSSWMQQKARRVVELIFVALVWAGMQAQVTLC